jgi:hypothetical protein
MAENVPQQVAAATAGGAAAETAQQMGLPEGVQFLAGMGGSMLGGKAAATSTTPALPRRTEVAMREAQRLGIEPLTSDVMPPQGMFGRFAQRVRESIPVTGTAGNLAEQQASKVSSLRNFMRGFGAEVTETAFDVADPAIERVTADLIANRRAMLRRFSAMRREAIDNAAASGAPTVPMPNAIAALENQINMLSGSRDYQDVVRILQGYRDDFLDYNNINNIDMIREAMGNRFSDPGLANIRDRGQRALESVYAPIRRDMENFIQIHGSDRDLARFRIANRRLHTEANQLERRSLRNALNQGDLAPETAATLLFSRRRSDVQALYNGLTADGRQAARAAILERAWNNMMRNNTRVNPDRFVGELRQLGTSVGVMFRNDDFARARGFAQAIELLERSGSFASMPPTGVVSQVPLVGGSLATLLGGLLKGREGIIGTASGILGIGFIGRIYESPQIRNILLRIPRLRTDPEKQLGTAQELMAAIQAYVSKEQEDQAKQESK